MADEYQSWGTYIQAGAFFQHYTVFRIFCWEAVKVNSSSSAGYWHPDWLNHNNISISLIKSTQLPLIASSFHAYFTFYIISVVDDSALRKDMELN